MKYRALYEGLVCATRLNLYELVICGNSDLIKRQFDHDGGYQVNDAILRVHQTSINTLLSKYQNLQYAYRTISREENKVADCLANMGIDLRENVTECNWKKINKLLE